MHTVTRVIDLQLREHGGHPAVTHGVADVDLTRPTGRRIDHELARFLVVARQRLEVAYVGAVRRLGHRVATGELQRADIGQVLLVMTLSAEAGDAATEQPELDAELHRQTQVVVAQHL